MFCGEVLNCFGIDYLEGRGILYKGRYMKKEDFLKYDISLLTENEIIGILIDKNNLNFYEIMLVKFWATLLKSKKLFEIASGDNLTNDEFDSYLKGFICSANFRICFEKIDWSHMFKVHNVLVSDNGVDFYENVANSMAHKNLLSFELIKRFDLKGVRWVYVGDKSSSVFTSICRNATATPGVIKFLLESVGDLSSLQEDDEQTVFVEFCASKAITFEAIKMFLDKGIDLNVRDSFKGKAFETLCKNEAVSLDMLELFRNKALIEFQKKDVELAFIALCSNRCLTIDMLKLFLDVGVNINTQDELGRSAFMIFCKNRAATLRMMRWFLEAGVDISIRDEYGADVMVCLSSNRSVTLDMLKLLLERGVDLEIRGEGGGTAFMNLCWNPMVTPNMIKLFIDSSVDINIQSGYGETALMCLCENKAITLDMIKLFIDNGVDIDVQDEHKETAFMGLCQNSAVTLDMIKIFIDNGVNINERYTTRETCFMFLVSNESVTLDIIRLCIGSGADISLVDEGGLSALDYYRSAFGQDPEILILLE